MNKAPGATTARGGSTGLIVAPTNDLCSAATVIPSSGGIINFSTVDATTTPANGQASACGAITKDIWFSWIAPRVAGGTTGNVTIETCNLTSLDTVLAVYTGSACAGTAGAALVCNTDACALQSSVSFQFTAGTTYLIQLGQPSSVTANGGNGALSVCIRRNRAAPGSLLVFPEFDNTAGQLTLYTVTHAAADPSAGATGHLRSVIIETVYVNGSNCTEQNFTRTLTPYDTLSLITKVQNINTTRGFFYVFAKSCSVPGQLDSVCPIVFNSLIGMETRIDGITNFDYSINAISFKALGNENDPNDDGTRPGFRELDDVNEYEGAPNQILIPRFLGQDDGVATNGVSSDIILLSLSTNQPINVLGTVNSTNLAGNPPYVCQSFGVPFTCWTKQSLNAFTGLLTSNTALSAFTGNEIVGFPTLRTGWITLDATPDAAYYAVLIEKAGPVAQQSAADLPFELCSQGDGRLRPVQ